MNPAMQNAYRHHPQAHGRSPAQARRAGPISQSHAQQQATVAAQQQAARNVQMEHQLAQRRSKKPNDRNMPDGVEDMTIGDGVRQYKELREVERKLDSAMVRKKLEMGDPNHRAKRAKTLRIWISNTVENQPWQQQGIDVDAFDFGSNEEATFKVRIEGRLLDDDLDITPDLDGENDDGKKTSAEGDAAGKLPAKTKRFSQFIKAMGAESDRSRTLQQDETPFVEWKRQPGMAEFDSIEFERKGDENMNITVTLVRTENPERYQLSPELAAVLDTDEDDKSGVLLGISNYIKAMGLQEDEERRNVRCDEALRRIFREDQIYFPRIPERILLHLKPLPPLELPYTIRVDSEYQSAPVPTIYDIRVSVEDPLHAQMVALTQNPDFPSTLRQLSFLDDQLAVVVQALAHSKAKHAFYRSMQSDPINFVKRWHSSQKRDLEVILGEATRGGREDGCSPEFQRGGEDGLWGSQVVQEAVRYKLAREGVTRR